MSKHLQKKKNQIDLNSFSSSPVLSQNFDVNQGLYMWVFLRIINVHVAKMSALH